MGSLTDIRRVYDAVANTYADYFPTTEPEQSIELAMLDHFVGQLPANARVLDAGCGHGRMMTYLAEGDCRVTGIDLSPAMIARANRDRPLFPTAVGSITDLPFPSASFDGILYWYSTIHLPDEALPRVFAEARRVLDKNGLVLVAFQAGSGSHEVGEGFRRLGHDVTLVRHHRSPDAVATLLRAAGFCEIARLVREPMSTESEAQAVLLARGAR